VSKDCAKRKSAVWAGNIDGRLVLRRVFTSNFAAAAKKLTVLYHLNLKLLSWWQRLQLAKSFGPNALVPL
jgi:hypothetical protein